MLVGTWDDVEVWYMGGTVLLVMFLLALLAGPACCAYVHRRCSDTFRAWKLRGCLDASVHGWHGLAGLICH